MRHVCPECGEAGAPGACPRDGTARVPASADPLLGTVIGSWRVARLLGTGGMGRVYLAVQPAIGARVAVKVLKVDAAADSDLVERFFNEARAVNVIRHEGIVDVFDLGRLPDGSPYIVMEHLDGASLGALLRRYRPFPLGTLGRLVGEVLAAVGAAHAKTIIHRDLKPDNVFVSPAGRVTVLDFGIAKLASADHVTTQTGGLLGTPAYMAPEQARSQPIDARADLYAAGVILFEGATGAPPFAAGSLYELLDLHVKTPPASPRSKNPAIPEALETVILRALAKDPAERFATAAAMREALLAAIADLPQSEFTELTITPAVLPGPPSDPLAPTAVTHGSLAHGETMPSERSSPVEKVRPSHVQLSRRTVGALAGVAVLGIAAAVVMAVREPERAAAIATPDAATIAHVTPVDGSTITVVAPVPPPIPVDAMLVDVPVDARPALRDAAVPADGRSKRPETALAVPPGSPVGAKALAIPNPKAFDPVRFYRRAHAAAVEKSGGPNINLYSLHFRGFDHSGKVDLTAGGWVEYVFASVDLAKAGEYYCLFIVRLEKGAGTISPAHVDGCAGRSMMPYCSLTEIWDKAAVATSDNPDAPFPADAQRANVIRRGRAGWRFTVVGSEFSTHITDDCEKSAAD